MPYPKFKEYRVRFTGTEADVGAGEFTESVKFPPKVYREQDPQTLRKLMRLYMNAEYDCRVDEILEAVPAEG